MLGARIERKHASPRAAAERPRTPTGRPRLGVRNLRVGTKLQRRLLRPAGWRGRRRRRARRPGPGRAVRRPRRLHPPGRRHDRGRRQAGAASPIRATPSTTASPMCPATAPRRCSCSARCARTSPCPSAPRVRNWGPIDMRRERATVPSAIERLQIDTRAQREVQRLSGGNQQKVTIARWIAADARTLLCFDPTRGIDVGTKQEIYKLLRELAAPGQVGAVLHLRARGGAARLRPRHRHLRRPRRRRAAGRDRRRSGADARRLRPAARRQGRCRHPRRRPGAPGAAP